MVGVCRASSAAIAPAKSRRVVLPAKSIAVLSSSERIAPDAPVTPFGARSAGDVVVLLSFESELGATAELAAAFLVLDPEPASPGPTGPIRIEASEILSAWGDGEPSWARAPRTGPTIGAAAVPPARRAPVRIDVTETLARSRGTGFGLALRSSGDDPLGARLVTAPGASTGPRLELYLK